MTDYDRKTMTKVKQFAICLGTHKLRATAQLRYFCIADIFSKGVLPFKTGPWFVIRRFNLIS